jgi:hypothetical protein
MASQALDLTTIGHALETLLTEHIGEQGWTAVNDDQQKFLEWYDAHREQIAKLDSLESLASTDYRVLNDFLTARRFAPKFDQNLDGVGVVSVLDMLVEWAAECKTTSISHYDPASGRRTAHPAFSVPAEGVRVFIPDTDGGISRPFVELKTTTGHSLWLREADQPSSGLDLALQAQALLGITREVHPSWTVGVTVPMLEMDLDTGLDWLTGMKTRPDWQVAQANQQFKLRANEKGARVKVATSIGLEAVSLRPKPYVFDEPFIGFFTQPGHPDLALAAFWADTDSWRNPEGTLEEL